MTKNCQGFGEFLKILFLKEQTDEQDLFLLMSHDSNVSILRLFENGL